MSEDAFAFDTLRVSVAAGVAHVQLEPHDDDGMLGPLMLLELPAALGELDALPSVRAVVIGVVCRETDGVLPAGTREVSDALAGREVALRGQATAGALAALPVPTVAALGGPVHGAALELALACDLRVAQPGATFALPGVQHGLPTAYGGTSRLARLIGEARAAELLLTGRTVSAQEALTLGLITRTAADAAADALALAASLAGTDGDDRVFAAGLIKEALLRGGALDLAGALEVEADLFGLAAAGTAEA